MEISRRSGVRSDIEWRERETYGRTDGRMDERTVGGQSDEWLSG